MSRSAWFVAIAFVLLAGRAQAQGVEVEDLPGKDPPTAGVVVELLSKTDRVRIFRIDGEKKEEVCASPCRQALPRDGVYQIGGDGIVPSAKFTLPDEDPALTLRVRPGSEAQRGTGVFVLSAGAATFFAGVVYSIYTFLKTPFDTPGDTRALDVALGLEGGGLCLIGLGALTLLTANTHVTTSRGVEF